MKRIDQFFVMLFLLSVNTTWAHDGHGQIAGSHWHSTDVFGFVAIAVVLAIIYFKRGGK